MRLRVSAGVLVATQASYCTHAQTHKDPRSASRAVLLTPPPSVLPRLCRRCACNWGSHAHARDGARDSDFEPTRANALVWGGIASCALTLVPSESQAVIPYAGGGTPRRPRGSTAIAAARRSRGRRGATVITRNPRSSSTSSSGDTPAHMAKHLIGRHLNVSRTDALTGLALIFAIVLFIAPASETSLCVLAGVDGALAFVRAVLVGLLTLVSCVFYVALLCLMLAVALSMASLVIIPAFLLVLASLSYLLMLVAFLIAMMYYVREQQHIYFCLFGCAMFGLLVLAPVGIGALCVWVTYVSAPTVFVE